MNGLLHINAPTSHALTSTSGGVVTPGVTSTFVLTSSSQEALSSEDDEDEPRLKIDVDEPMTSSSFVTSATSVGHPPGLTKSISVDGNVFQLREGPPKTTFLPNLTTATTRHAVLPMLPRSEVKMETSSASEAIESLLLLGQGPVLSPSFSSGFKQRSNSVSISSSSSRSTPRSSSRRYSTSSSGDAAHGGQGEYVMGANGSYYQRMRERNNEASKRCRLKRRMKAEGLEFQANSLGTSNKVLKLRIAKLEKMGMLLKEGVKQIQSSRCSCVETVAKIRMAVTQMDDRDGHLSNQDLITNSKRCRNQSDSHNSISSEDEQFNVDPLVCAAVAPVSVPVPAAVPAAAAQKTADVAKLIKIPGRAELSVTPLAEGVAGKKTAQDAINDTIIRCLNQEKPIPPPISVGGALNLVKIASPVVTPIVTSAPPAFVLNGLRPQNLTPTVITPSTGPNTKQIIVLSSNPVVPRTREPSVSSVISIEESSIKCEPEIQIVECEPPRSNSLESSDLAEEMDEGVDPTVSCVAAAQGSREPCEGHVHDLGKLTNYLDLVSKTVSRDTGTAAMERQLLKSRLKIPFWKADEMPTYICERHRNDIVHKTPLTNCSMCHKKKAKKVSSPQSTMWTITYRMSLEHYTTTGNILPIGLLVCGNCKDKHLKGLDFANSMIVEPDGSLTPGQANETVTPVAVSRHNSNIGPMILGPNGLKKAFNGHTLGEGGRLSVITKGGVTISRSPIVTPASEPLNSEVKVVMHPVQREQQPAATSLPSPSKAPVKDVVGSANQNIFAKIGRLNESLNAINPNYKPIGFSITSIESCSESVLQDAIHATETAVSTLMSVIAPGQEAFLWSSIKPKLDAKFMSEPSNDANSAENNVEAMEVTASSQAAGDEQQCK